MYLLIPLRRRRSWESIYIHLSGAEEVFIHISPAPEKFYIHLSGAGEAGEVFIYAVQLAVMMAC